MSRLILLQSGEAGGRGIRSTAPARAGRSNEKSNRRPGCDLLGHHGRMWQNPLEATSTIWPEDDFSGGKGRFSSGQ